MFLYFEVKYSIIFSFKYPTIKITSSKSGIKEISSIMKSIIVEPAIGKIGFGFVFVCGLNLVPSPAAGIITFKI